jgi:hypothetical protein
MLLQIWKLIYRRVIADENVLQFISEINLFFTQYVDIFLY